MKIIVYKKRSKFYECTGIKDDGGNDVRIIFDEPICGSFVIRDKTYPIVRGVCKTSLKELFEGECSPNLFTNGKKYRLEHFFIKDGIILRSAPDGDYVRELYENYSRIQEKLIEIESKLNDITDKITQKIKF